MAGRLFSLAFGALLLGVSAGFAAPSGDALAPMNAAPAAAFGSQPGVDAAERKPIQLAQAHVFDVYVDAQGRQVIVDSETGEVVEVRPPGGGAQVQPRARRQRDLYDFDNPREVARPRRRDRDVELGRREPPVRDRRQVRIGPDGFPEAPQAPQPRVRQNPPVVEPFTPGTVERAPLAAPSGGDELASAPDDQSRDFDADDGTFDDNNRENGSFDNVTPDDAGGSFSEPGQPAAVEPFVPGDRAITVPGARGASEQVAKFQVLLDRAGASPGVIDGRMGDNVNKAIDAYKEITGHGMKTYDKGWVDSQLAATGGPAFSDYTITAQDAAGPYVASIPSDYGEKAQLQRLSYTRVSEMLAERFHMDEDYLKKLNPRANFNRPGTIIKVINPGRNVDGEVASIIADKGRKQVRGYDAQGNLLVAYPTTIGSTDTPSPTGTHAVKRIAFDPDYTYNPKINFKQGANDQVLTIPPGPNGPVGSIWIALDKPTYGIHGTPEPSTIGKTSSHGCVRLTNWDATELAKIVTPGVTVEFTE